MELAIKKFFDIAIVIILGLVGLAYNKQGKEIEEIKKNERECVIHVLGADIAEMKTDIKWIKGKIFNKN